MKTATIALAQTPEQISRCYDVMRELRPHLDAAQFLAQVRRQQAEQGFKLAFAEDGGVVRSAAGYRIYECLAWGKFLYVDDLVSRATDHGKGYGSMVFDWVLEQARVNGCAQFHLDSGVHRHPAHRFYLHKGMDITCHHFALKFDGTGSGRR